MKQVYLAWYSCYKTLPKQHRYSLGQKIDALLIQIIEAIASASFLPKADKLPYVRLAVRKVDTLKLLLLIAWETQSLDTKKYIALSTQVDEVGRMLGGWTGQLSKQNSPRP